MSTNFYLKKIPTQPRLKEIKDFIDMKVPSFKKMLNERFFVSRKELSDFINAEFPSEDCLYSFFVSNSSDYAVQKVRDFRWDLEQRIDSYDIEFNDESVFNNIALVTKPAIQETFIQLSKQEDTQIQLKIDEEKRMVSGPALIPDQPIYRKQGGRQFYINTARTPSQKWL